MSQMNQESQMNQMNQGITAGQVEQAPKQDTLILFFHENSKACQKLKAYLPKDKPLQIVNVEQLQTIPSSISSIPSLVINNNKILKGKEVFDYFTKSDEMDYIDLSTKNSGFSFSLLDNDSIEPNSMYSSINDMEYSGIPTWNEEDENNNRMDIDKFQIQRDEAIKGIQPSPQKPNGQ